MTSGEFRIIVDWGSTNGRAWLLEGAVVSESIEWSQGILFGDVVQKRAFLGETLSAWTSKHPVEIILGVGMLGSRTGLLEVSYLEVPVSESSWAGAAEEAGLINEVPVRIFPGVSTISSLSGLASIMRGEESKFFGALSVAMQSGSEFDVLVTPGTHSKWIANDQGEIRNYETFPTGEIFDHWRYRSSLSVLIPEDAELTQAGFDFGLRIAAKQASWSSALFSLRAEVLLGRLSVSNLVGAISGVLIGAEILNGRRLIGDSARIAVTGADALVSLYSVALEQYDIRHELLTVGPTDFVRQYLNYSFVEESA